MALRYAERYLHRSTIDTYVRFAADDLRFADWLLQVRQHLLPEGINVLDASPERLHVWYADGMRPEDAASELTSECDR